LARTNFVSNRDTTHMYRKILMLICVLKYEFIIYEKHYL